MQSLMAKKEVTIPLSISWKERSKNFVGKLRVWLFSWEIYLIIGLAAFLRLYRIETTEFDGDQADIFRMAHDAIIHGHLVVTSNIASINIYNPPGVVYFLMIPAAFSANPLGGAIWTALLAILAVVFTYIFTRHYYGRLAGTIAALTYGTASAPVFYSRFMWNQNFLLLFVPLFIGLLFWGVVDRHKGWLILAIPLFGLLIQFHASSGFLLAPFCVALLLVSWKTIRWYDIPLGVLLLFVIYSPYIVWLFYSHFRDFTFVFHHSSYPTVTDKLALLFYRHMISPYDKPFTNIHSVLYHFLYLISWLQNTMTALVIGGAVLALRYALWSRLVVRQRTVLLAIWKSASGWWMDLRAAPMRGSLLILLIWQLTPLVALIKHSLNLFPHYFIMVLPGPFILIGLLMAQAATWLEKQRKIGLVMRLLLYGLVVAIVSAQFLASTSWDVDAASGNNSDHIPYNATYSNDLNSMQQALAQADQLAEQQHYNRVFVTADLATQSGFRYLVQQMHTPTTVVDNTSLVLPGAAYGPAVLLVPPYNSDIDELATHYAHAKLVASPKRLGGPPFHLYVVQPLEQLSTPSPNFSQNLTFESAQPLTVSGQPWIVTRWSLLQSAEPYGGTTYTYDLKSLSSNQSQSSASDQLCVFTSIRAGDQLLALFKRPQHNQSSLRLKAQYYTTAFETISFKPLNLFHITFDTFSLHDTSLQLLKTADGSDTFVIETP